MTVKVVKPCWASTFVLKSGLKIWFEGATKDYISEEGLQQISRIFPEF